MSNQLKPEEYSPFFNNYISKIGDAPIVNVLSDLKNTSYNFLSGIPASKADYAYAEGKWTLKQVIGHMTDAERTFAYRVLAFSRGQAELPGFDEDEYVARSTFNTRTIGDLIEEFKLVREANLSLYKSLTQQQQLATGIANGNIISVRALLYIAAGHEMHHIDLIKERYL